MSTAARADCTAEHKRARALRDTLASVGETTPEYRSMMLKKIQDAETAANNCDRAAVDAKRAEEARAAEKKREADAAAKREAADAFTIAEMKSQADFIRRAWSAYECSYEKQRDTIANNPFATDEQKEQLRRIEVILSGVHGAMKRGKISQLPCRVVDVAKLAFCLADNVTTPACHEPTIALMIRADKEIIAAEQVTPSAPPLTPDQQRKKEEEDGMEILEPKF